MEHANGQRQNPRMSMEMSLFLLSVALLIAGSAGYITFKNLLSGYLLAHVGALGLIAMLACLAAVIARKRGYSYWRAFAAGLVLPIIAGTGFASAALFLGQRGEPMICGGAVSLAVSILICIGYSLATVRSSTKSDPKQI
jgi:hypothetical protein